MVLFGQLQEYLSWLDKWKRRYNVTQLKISGESADVNGATVDSWKEHLPEIVSGYEKDDIWNMDETGLIWRTLPDRGFAHKKECKGGKKQKQRITIAFCHCKRKKRTTNRNPEIRESQVLERVDKNNLPVTLFSQSKSWMTGAIMESIQESENITFFG